MWHYIAPLVLLILGGPYIYYSLLINNTALENPREGYKFPYITDFWMSAVGALVTMILKKIMPPLF